MIIHFPKKGREEVEKMRALLTSAISRIIPSLIMIYALCIPAYANYSSGNGEPRAFDTLVEIVKMSK